MEHNTDSQVFLLHKNYQPQIKIGGGAIFHIATFNCNVIGHLTFQMKKVLVTIIEPPDVLHCVVRIAAWA